MATRVDIEQALAGIDPATRAAFLQAHRECPDVWKYFEKFALDAIASGREHYGAKGIMERVRWHTEIEHGIDFKCNNNFTAYYARIFAAKYPVHADFFEFREVSGLRRAA